MTDDEVNALLNLAQNTRAHADVLAERAKQIAQWGDDHDDEHQYGTIRIQAAALAVDGTDARVDHPKAYDAKENFDPWGLVARYGYCGSKPNKRKALVIAAALLLAEIERLDRCEAHASRSTP